MSTIEVNSIQPLSSGTTITLGANGKTLDVPSGATLDLTGSTVSGLTTGKIGQVINVNKVMSTTAITSTSSVAIANYEATITPTATSSKIFVLATYSYTQDGGSNGVLAFTQIYRGTSNILGGIAGGDTDFGDYGHTVSLSTVDSPSTTSATTYKIHAQVQNSSSQFRPTSNSDSLTLMEILA